MEKEKTKNHVVVAVDMRTLEVEVFGNMGKVVEKYPVTSSQLNYQFSQKKKKRFDQEPYSYQKKEVQRSERSK